VFPDRGQQSAAPAAARHQQLQSSLLVITTHANAQCLENLKH